MARTADEAKFTPLVRMENGVYEISMDGLLSG
jgi:hypothetical protein